MVEAGVQTVYHYLDDFIVLGLPSSEICAEHLQILHKVCNDLGVPLAQEKQEGPDTTITFLGITIDTNKFLWARISQGTSYPPNN